jgi:hypothetical protein
VELPPFAATRVWVDFRGAEGPEYQRRFGELVAALRGERPPRPEPDGRLVLPAGTGVRPEGARRALLRIAADQTVLTVDGQQAVGGRPVGPSHELEARLWQAERARRRRLAGGEAMVRATHGAAGVDASGVQQRLVEVGLGLAAFLAAWVRSPGMSRLLVTSRYPFTLPDRVHQRLETLHLGPLSWAETRKLIWRLPGLDALTPDQQQRAWTDVGGHPRSLEYLDALLRGGTARFDDIAERMEDTLSRRGISDPEQWLRDAGGDLDRALAAAVTLAVDEVLLGWLLDQLEGAPLARKLLLGVSVYRLPVDLIGVAWQMAGQLPGPPEQGESKLHVPERLQEALAILRDLGLITPVESSAPGNEDRRGTETFLVHRWTARALADLASPSELAAAHDRAARYWRWRAHQAWPQDRKAAIDQFLEARHHHQAAAQLDDAVQVTGWVCLQLHTWGAWSWEERLCRETLAVVPERSRHAAACTQQLGTLAERRGDYHQALDRYRQALTIFEDLGDHAGMATTMSQIGIFWTETGEAVEGVRWNLRSLGIRLQIGSPESRINLQWLVRQRELLGSQRFERIVRAQLDDESANAVVALIERWNASDAVDPGGSDPAPR